jgi:hypothetical protein
MSDCDYAFVYYMCMLSGAMLVTSAAEDSHGDRRRAVSG